MVRINDSSKVKYPANMLGEDQFPIASRRVFLCQQGNMCKCMVMRNSDFFTSRAIFSQNLR
jgi:hypothetical protein